MHWWDINLQKKKPDSSEIYEILLEKIQLNGNNGH